MDSSSASGLAFSLLTGETNEVPDIKATFRVGGSSTSRGTEYAIAAAGSDLQHGPLTWDAFYSGVGSSLSGFAPARLALGPNGARWSVGTGPLVACECKPFQRLKRIQIAAGAVNREPGRSIQWETLDLLLRFQDGRSKRYSSACLPKVRTGHGVRRSSGSTVGGATSNLRQFVDVNLEDWDVASLEVQGRVSLQVDGAMHGLPLEQDDLYGQVLVFTSN